MIYKTFQKVSNVCQLLDKSKYPATATTGSGITMTNNGDGTFAINGTATNDIYFSFNSFGDSLSLSHKYLVTGENSGLYLFVENRDKDNKILYQLNHNVIRSLPNNTKKSSFQCYIKSGAVCDNLVLKPQLFDLTEMYGAGNEPTTVEEFRQDFPEEMYDYSPHCFVTSYKNCLKVSNVCQLLDKRTFPATTTIAGVTFTNNSDGTITANGTATYTININIFEGFSIKKNHKYLILDCTGSTSRKKYSTWLKSGIGGIVCDSADKPIGNLTYNDDKGIIFIRVENGVTVDNLTFKPQLFDLTEMYGAGHEPTTVEQFKADFPDELYDYKPYNIVPSYKKSLVCKTKNLFDINRLKGINYLDVYGNSLKCFKYATSVYDISVLNIFKSLKPNTIYTMSATVNKYITGADGRITLVFSNGSTLILFNINQPGYRYRNFSLTQEQIDRISSLIFYGEDESAGGPIIWSNIQIEEGDTATDYVPYGHL